MSAPNPSRALGAFAAARAAYMSAFAAAAPCLREGEPREALVEIERLFAVVERALVVKERSATGAEGGGR